MNEAVLEVRNLVKYFGKRKIIDNVSFKVYPGEIFGFLGPNGAGKTTTIKMIMGFLAVDGGEIFINGIPLNKDYEKAMENIGGIVENPEMYKDLSGQLNLEMYARLHKGVTKERISEVVELVGMQNRIKDKVKKYSLGMKQRMGVAQSILHKPRILILDEPTNGLDPAGIKELRDIFKKLSHEEGVAVFVSSHLLAEMQLMCDRVGIIDNGKLIGVKPIQELISDAAGGVFYRLNTPNGANAAEKLPEDIRAKIKTIAEDYIEIETDEQGVPEIIKILVMSGVSVSGVVKIESSLEDAFITLTGGRNSIE